MKYFIHLLLFAVSAGTYCSALAATNGLDANFGSNGIVLLGPTPTSGVVMNRISAVKVLDDGRIVIGGFVWGSSDPEPQPAVGRLDADGNWDTSFADHGLFVLPYGSDSAPYGGRIHNVDVFSDGSILATGGIHQFGGYYYSCTLLIKLTPTGALASGFAPDKSGSYCFDFAPPPPSTCCATNHSDGAKIDSDDTFFLTSIQTNLSVGAVAHLDASGTLVNTYATNGIAGLPLGVYSVLLDILPGHEVLAAGVYAEIGSQGFGAARLHDGGDFDATYGVAGVASVDVQQNSNVGIIRGARDAQDRLLLSSYAYISGDDFPYRIARLTASGLTDTTFNGNGQQAGSPGVASLTLSGNTNYDSVLGAQPLPDGHILVVGENAKVSDTDGTFNISLLRLNDDASWDNAFGDAMHPGWASINIGGMATSDARPLSLTVDPRNGRIVAGIGTSDSNGHGCVGLIRVVADRLFTSAFDEVASMPNCPQ